MDIPAGIIVAFGGEVPPDGWELCYGQSVSKNDDSYKDLWRAIGTAHGGDGNPNFNLPDYRGRFLRGVSHGTGNDPDALSRTAAAAGGNAADKVGSVQPDEIGSHAHTCTTKWLQADGGSGFEGWGFDSNSTARYGSSTTNAAGGHESRPKNAYVEYIIKL